MKSVAFVTGMVIVLLGVTGSGAMQTAVDQSCPTEPLSAVLGHAIRTLLDAYYDPVSGLFGWGLNSANALTTLANAAVRHPARYNATRILGVLNNTFRINKNTHFITPYYEDEGFWALCWIAAADLAFAQNDFPLAEEFLDAVEYLGDNIYNGWGMSCGGGLQASQSDSYKNAIPNELFLQLTSALALRRGNITTQRLADNELTWFLQYSGLINGQLLVNDGLDANCSNNHDTTWTYNQGVLLGGLVNMYRLEGNLEYLLYAMRLAQASMAALSVNGTLVEPCEPHCGADGSQFKGIYMRNLMYLFEAVRKWWAIEQAYPSGPVVHQFLKAASKYLVLNGMKIATSDCSQMPVQGTSELGWFFGLMWRGPFDKADASRQSSAMDGLLAAVVAQRW